MNGPIISSADSYAHSRGHNTNGSATADKLESLEFHPTRFNEYINPGESTIWEDQCTNTHGIWATDDGDDLAHIMISLQGLEYHTICRVTRDGNGTNNYR